MQQPAPSTVDTLASAGPDLGGLISMAGLVVVIGAIAVALLRLLARRGAGSATGAVRIVDRVVLGPRRAVYLLQCRGRELLIGASEDGLRLLARLPDDGEHDFDVGGDAEPGTNA